MTDRNCPNCNCNKDKTKHTVGDLRVVECSDCTLQYLVNPPNEEDLYEEYYKDNVYLKQDYKTNSNNARLAELFDINEQRLQFIQKEKTSGTMLDIGCGLGFFLNSARHKGFEVTGIDVSEKSIKYAIDELNINAKVKSLDALISEGKKFDVITLWHVLEHFINPIDELNKIKSLLTDDGICFIEVPNTNSLKFILAKNKWVGGNHPLYHRSFFTTATLKETLLKSGFTDINRIQASYKLGNRNSLYELSKTILNLFAMDAFLNFSVKK